MAKKRRHHPGGNLGAFLHPKNGSKPMAKPPMAAAAPPAMAASAPGADDSDMDASGAASGGSDAGDTGGDVLLTVLKNDDGTYTLIEGDEGDGDEGGDGTAGGGMGGDTDEPPGKQYDSKGALLKAILDILNEDEESQGGDAGGGSAEDQFQAGFGGASGGGAAGGTAMAQKY